MLNKGQIENVGITLNERSQIPINDHFQTSAANIYAIGDVIQGMILAHKASEESVVYAKKIIKQIPDREKERTTDRLNLDVKCGKAK